MDSANSADAANPASANDTGLPASNGNSRCSEKAERKGLPVNISRMMALTTAVDLLGGQRVLAQALGIDPRSLRAKLAAERGVSDDDLTATAQALNARASRISDHAAKLLAVASQ